MRGKVCGELSVSYFSEQHCSFHVHVGPTQQMKTPPKSSLFQGPAKWSASRGPAPAKASSPARVQPMSRSCKSGLFLVPWPLSLCVLYRLGVEELPRDLT